MLLLPFVFAILVPFLYKRFVSSIHTGWFVMAVPLVIFLYFLSLIPEIAKGNVPSYTAAWIPSVGINYSVYADGLSLIFGLLITGVGALVVLYSIYYLSKKREALHNFYVYLLLFMGAMLGVVFSDNILVLYVFWEMTSVASFLLIAYWYQRGKSRYGAQKSLLITVMGGLCMLAGFILLSMMADTYSIREQFKQISTIQESPLFLPAMLLILTGAFTKSAQFPFSIWLPDAMEAPTPISAYLHSATMVKAGIYLVARLTPIFGGTGEWFWLVSGIGMITLLYGSLNAVKQKDLKGLLAFSTISQLGLIMSLLGLGSASVYFGGGEESSFYAVAVFAALFHLVNHSTFKGSLFMVVGIIDHETGTRDIRRLGGLMALMPLSFTVAVIGSFSMAGLPPFNGFLSKEMFFTGVLHASKLQLFGMDHFGTAFLVVAWVASVFTFIYCMILVFKTFTGEYEPLKLEKEAHEAPIGMLIAPLILAGLVVLIFFFPNTLADYLLHPALNVILPEIAANGGLALKISAWHGFTPELFMTFGVVAFGVLMYIYLWKWVRLYRLYPQALTLNHLYDAGLEGIEGFSRGLTGGYMTGYSRDYLRYIFLFMIILVGGALWLLDGVSFDFSKDAPIRFYEGGLVLGMFIAALTVLFSKTRLVSLVAVGAVGYLLSMLFVVMSAPDLALTQIVVETVTVTLFLLCFRHLPELWKEKLPFKWVNMLISVGVGALVTLTALAANGHKLFDSISGYYKNSYELAGAKNIVNSILVDFRGLDTMLEIFVLCIASLGVYTLIKIRMSGGGDE
ncbi:Na+/H+ antiporter subunit A [Bacillus massiliglaciei]|uniref:Na+/H+ antiporter subunit A n=1 Tax=Bacillus massiliglaciei TaxID=1816693 RepID=UPI000DA6094C|nr:Na+/H+ antiporter subunit A [Bacillus massiliglaciei]